MFPDRIRITTSRDGRDNVWSCDLSGKPAAELATRLSSPTPVRTSSFPGTCHLGSQGLARRASWRAGVLVAWPLGCLAPLALASQAAWPTGSRGPTPADRGPTLWQGHRRARSSGWRQSLGQSSPKLCHRLEIRRRTSRCCQDKPMQGENTLGQGRLRKSSAGKSKV